VVFVSIDITFEKMFELPGQYMARNIKSGAYVQLQAPDRMLGGYSYQ
jgi:hypothetical protein